MKKSILRSFYVIALVGSSIVDASNPIVTLKSMTNSKYVCADNAGSSPLVANRDGVSTWEKFEKIDLGNGTFAFKALANSRYVCAENSGNNPLIANCDSTGTWESFWIVNLDAGKMALKSVGNNKFVCAENAGKNPLVANRSSAQGWETFEMNDVSDDATSFTIAVIPDSQFMVCSWQGGTPAMFERQIQWVANRVHDPAMNVVFVSHLGDITDDGSQQWQWDSAKSAMFKLDTLVPYGIAPGNHDSMVMWNSDYSLLNQNFTTSKYIPQSWFGGTYQANQYENNYELFSADGLEFIIIHMAWNPGSDVRSWASGLLRQYSSRRAIIATHEYLPVNGGPTAVGMNIWNDVVRSNSNVFMVICGHNHGESLLTSTNDAGTPVYQILTDYQGDNPQVGRMRYYTFKPGENIIVVSTYATETSKYQWNYNLSYNMK